MGSTSILGAVLSRSGEREVRAETCHHGGAGRFETVTQGAIDVDEITLKDFRCFREEQTARLAPLTLLVGENSTGKSSFLAVIRALSDVAYRQEVPDFKEEPFDLGSFDEIAHHRGARGGRATKFGAGFSTLPPTRRGEQRPDGTALRFEVTFGRAGTAPVPVMHRILGNGTRIEFRHDRLQLRLATPGGSWSMDMSDGYRSVQNEEGDLTVISFLTALSLIRHLKATGSGDVPVPQDGSGPFTDKDHELLHRLVRPFETDFRSKRRPYASAPVRSRPRRTYDPARTVRDPEGDHVPMFLAGKFLRDRREWDKLRDRLEAFGRASGLFDELSIRLLGKRDSEPFQVQVRKYAGSLKGPQRNLVDVGYGVSQVLPVITELLRRDAPPRFLLQQPEVHLHPSAQAALGGLFCKVAGRERQLVVETHSDHILDRVRMDIRDGTSELKPEDVSILYFERGALDVRIHSLRLDRQGNVLDAPDSYRRFFMEETTRSLGL